MKRSKLLAIIDAAIERHHEVPSRPVTFDTLEVDFDARRVTFRGRTINSPYSVLSFPMLNTDRMVIVDRGEVV